jgi:hypothetical protein
LAAEVVARRCEPATTVTGSRSVEEWIQVPLLDLVIDQKSGLSP